MGPTQVRQAHATRDTQHLEPLAVLLPLAIAVAFAAVAWRVGALSLSGALAAGLLAWVLLLPRDLAWAAPGVTFFVLSSILSRVGRRRKAGAERFAEKAGPRDAGQVIANGGVAGILVVAFLLLPESTSLLGPAFYWGMVGAFAAAAADTWATEVGTMVGGRTVRLSTLAPVPPGSSGGVSAAGSLAALAGALSVVGAASVMATGSLLPGGASLFHAAALALAGAIAGCLVDSMLGSTLQARYRLASGQLTEKSEVAGRALPQAGGWSSVNNDRVNVLCTLVGAAFPFGAFIRAGLA
jgi:uncharacterized protein (TIGR00297 family)